VNAAVDQLKSNTTGTALQSKTVKMPDGNFPVTYVTEVGSASDLKDGFYNRGQLLISDGNPIDEMIDVSSRSRISG